jgi:DNA-binding GntR family transcriptional regulator
MTDPAHQTGASGGESLADYALGILRDRLIVLEIRPGAPVNDEQIGKELGIGRTPVREALKRLETEHLVTVYPRRGTFASTVDITDLAQISEIREQLEPLAAAKAARHATPAVRAELTALAEELRGLDLASIDTRDLMRYDLRVHRAIYASCGNRHLEETLLRYDNLATRIWCLVLDRIPEIGSHITEHIELLLDIAGGHHEKAATDARDHVVAFERLIRTVL